MLAFLARLLATGDNFVMTPLLGAVLRISCDRYKGAVFSGTQAESMSACYMALVIRDGAD